MDIWKKHISPSGYYTNPNGIDSYGVDHSNFTLAEELEYQYNRTNQENKILQQMKQHGSDLSLSANNEKTDSFTTESAWGYPNTVKTSFYNYMGRPYGSQSYPEYKIGTLSGLYESNNTPTAIGVDNSGGPSYGNYQIATATGTMNSYLNFLNQDAQYKSFEKTLNDAGGINAAQLKSQSFVDAWTELSKDPEFNESQSRFIVETHLTPLLNAIKEKNILNLKNRHPVVKDALYSMSVQHGKAAQIVNNALNELKQTYGDKALFIDDETLLKALYNKRSEYVNSLSESQYKGDKKISKQDKMNIVNKRYPAELMRALQYLK